MKKNNQKMLFVFVFFLSLNLFSQADRMEFVYGDKLPDAPLLSSRGDHQVGVMTMNLVHSNQIDILKSSEDNDVFYDRPLTVEVWYPAKLKESEVAWEVYDEVMGNLNDPKRPLIPFKSGMRSSRYMRLLEGIIHKKRGLLYTINIPFCLT